MQSAAPQAKSMALQMASTGVMPAPGQSMTEAMALLAAARNAAYAEAARGRLGHGVHVLLRALSTQPMSFELQADMAAILLTAGEFAHAASYARAALDIHPAHGPSLYALGFALSGLGEASEAATTLRRLTRGKPRQSLMEEAPDLMPLVRTELTRLGRLDRLSQQQAARKASAGRT